MTAINGFIYRTRAGTKIISPVGLELESTAIINPSISREWDISAETVALCRQHIIQTCWNMREIRQKCMVSHTNRLRRAFANEDTKEWADRFTKPFMSTFLNTDSAVTPVCGILSDFFDINKPQNTDVQIWMTVYTLHIAELVMAIETYYHNQIDAAASDPDLKAMENLGWVDDWLTELNNLAEERLPCGESYLVRAEIQNLLLSVVNNAVQKAFDEYLCAFDQWEKMPGIRRTRELLILKAVGLKIILDELRCSGYPGADNYMNKAKRLLEKNKSVRKGVFQLNTGKK